MKYIFSTILFVFSILIVAAQPAAEKIAVKIKAGKFSIDKAVVSDAWKYDIVSVALGANDRKRGGFNTTHSYDNFGIVLFEKNDSQKIPTGIISEVQFYLAAGDTNSVTPKGFFTGKMQIESLKISSNTRWDVLKEKLKGFTLTESYMEHNFRLANKGLYFYFLFNAAEDTLLKISIGKDTRTIH